VPSGRLRVASCNSDLYHNQTMNSRPRNRVCSIRSTRSISVPRSTCRTSFAPCSLVRRCEKAWFERHQWLGALFAQKASGHDVRSCLGQRQSERLLEEPAHVIVNPSCSVPEPHFASIQVPAQIEYPHHGNHLAPQAPVDAKLELILFTLRQLLLAGARPVFSLSHLELSFEQRARNTPPVHTQCQHQVGVQE